MGGRHRKFSTGRAELSAVMESMTDAVFLLDSKANIVQANGAAKRLAGVTAKQQHRPLAGHQHLQPRHLDGRPMAPADHPGIRAIHGETTQRQLMSAHTPDGHERILEVSAAPVPVRGGGVARAVVVARDVTEVEQARTGFSVARLATAVAGAGSRAEIIRAVLDEAGAALDVDVVGLYAANPEARRLELLGHRNAPPELVEPLGVISLDAPSLSARAAVTGKLQIAEDLERAELAIPRLIRDHVGPGSLVTVPLMARRRVVGVLSFATRGPRRYTKREQETLRLIGDIIAVGLENARLLEQANEERRRLAAIIDASPGAVILFSAPEGRIVTANKAAAKILGQPTESGLEMAEHPRKFGLFRLDGRPYAGEELPSGRALRGEVVVGEEVVVRPPGGDEVPILVSAAPIRDETAKVTESVVVFQDISRIKQLERQREEFINTISHDLRTPLSVILGKAEVLRLAGADPDQLDRGLAAIITCAQRMAGMIQQLVDSARVEAGHLCVERVRLNLRPYLEELCDRLAATLNMEPVQLDLPQALPPVVANPDCLERVVVNLLGNALKYSAPGMSVILRARECGSEVEISVADHGRGIAAEDIPHLFERYYRTHEARRREEGLGLGLFISKALVEANGGRLWVESEIDKGSTFRFTLAVCPPGEPPVASPT